MITPSVILEKIFTLQTREKPIDRLKNNLDCFGLRLAMTKNPNITTPTSHGEAQRAAAIQCCLKQQ
ncbi:hypothetical protein [Nitrosomonas sp.]|uniref:hypothetical protein n=1 Tax=Nitrosomonas sp. TaxID=42353 RepID=UPI0026153461|nr:hypothetical protein [Nitrosomonas sp.]MCW5600357.1 hypothetical protein [Nitrosomonas sp.]